MEKYKVHNANNDNKNIRGDHLFWKEKRKKKTEEKRQEEKRRRIIHTTCEGCERKILDIFSSYVTKCDQRKRGDEDDEDNEVYHMTMMITIRRREN